MSQLHVCLSSASSEQYRRDVLRALAMPSGAILQFRYHLQDVDNNIRTSVYPSVQRPARALIAYFDKSTVAQQHGNAIVPCRFATIVGVQELGRSFLVRLSLDAFCRMHPTTRTQSSTTVPSDAEAALLEFNKHIRISTQNRQPTWNGTEFRGAFWLITDTHDSVTPSSDLRYFEDTVTELSRRLDFTSEALFYNIFSIRPTSESTPAQVVGGECIVHANSNYEMLLYNYHPRDTQESQLQIVPGSSAVSITTNATLHFSSPYDLKRIGLRVSNPAPPQGEFPVLDPDDPRAMEHTGSVISIFRNHPVDGTDRRYWDFDIPIRIRPDFESVVKYGSTLGVGLAVPSIITIAVNDRLSAPARVGLSILALGVSALGGIWAAYGLRKPTP